MNSGLISNGKDSLADKVEWVFKEWGVEARFDIIWQVFPTLMAMAAAAFREIALSFSNTEEKAHFDRTAFRIINKRIFATLHEKSMTANMRLPLPDQKTFCDYHPAIYPVPNKWGQQGWTTFEITILPKDVIAAALDSAYRYALG